jgi:hypothetical protein
VYHVPKKEGLLVFTVCLNANVRQQLLLQQLSGVLYALSSGHTNLHKITRVYQYEDALLFHNMPQRQRLATALFAIAVDLTYTEQLPA